LGYLNSLIDGEEKMIVKVDEKIAEAAVLGGAFYGGGGGGDYREGLRYARLALELGEVYIVDVESISPERYVATASIIGAPAAREKYVLPSHMIRAVELLMDNIDVPLDGLITGENGGLSSVNGWIQSAILGIPIIDAPGDGRAHPTGVMGSLGLHKIPDYVSIQAAVGGDKKAGRYVELVVQGSLEKVDKIIREASIQAGGMIAVARNPITVDYLKDHAAVGALSKAIEVGRVFQKHLGDPLKIAQEVTKLINGKIIDEGTVEYVSLETRSGYDIGRLIINGRYDKYEITFWNEYMTVEDSNSRRIASFPDLIVTLNVESGLPITSAEIRKNDKIILIVCPEENILLGAGVKDPQLLSQVEEIIGKKIT